jgi:preprotein translocase subunit YajC
MGTHILAAHQALAAAAKSSSSSSASFLIIIVVIFGLLYFFMIRPQRNRQRQAQQTAKQVGDGARIRTTAGMYGTIISGDDDNVLVEFAPGVRIKVMRRAIMGVVPDDEPDGIRQTVPDVSDADGSATFGDREDNSI